MLPYPPSRVVVPGSSTTVYGGSDPREFFADAVGAVLAHGPRAVKPNVRAWLREVAGMREMNPD
jgi:hypothetical protein